MVIDVVDVVDGVDVTLAIAKMANVLRMSLVSQPILLVYYSNGELIGLNKYNGKVEYRINIPIRRVVSSKKTDYYYKIDGNGQVMYGKEDYLEKLPLTVQDLALMSPTKSGQLLITGSVKNEFIVVKNGKITTVASQQCIRDGIVIGISTYSVKLIHLHEDVVWELEYTTLHGHTQLLNTEYEIQDTKITHKNWSFDLNNKIIGYFDATFGISHDKQFIDSKDFKNPKVPKVPKDLSIPNIDSTRYSIDLNLPSCGINSPFYPDCALVPSTLLEPQQVNEQDELLLGAVFVFILLFGILYYRLSRPRLRYSKFVLANFQLTSPKIHNEFEITDEVLGHGSNGTIVYKGTFSGRTVAIKRILKEFVLIAEQEVQLLLSSDIHENITRLFYITTKKEFVFVILEYCDGNLEQFVDKYPMYNEIDILKQLSSGVHFLHQNLIIHRDLKPLNILYQAKRDSIVFKITDFGLGKQLQSDKSSFMTITSGTKGWRCPEILQLLNEPENEIRLTSKVDIFSLGCLFYYVVSHGHHPFGDVYKREVNILQNNFDLDNNLLDKNELFESNTLIESMIHHSSDSRPSSSAILKDNLFWTIHEKLNFICAISNLLETENRGQSFLLDELESNSIYYDSDWSKFIDKSLFTHLNKYRKYHPHLIQDLLRSIRNLVNHFQELPPQLTSLLTLNAKPTFIDVPIYFLKAFPNLISILVQYSNSTGLHLDQ